MALDNRFRFDELVKQGSKAIVSEDPISKTHTFIDGGTTIVSASQEVPYEYIQGERDGEIVNYIEKPAYTEEELIRAVDVNIDELVKPPKEPKPDVVPRPVYDELEDRFQQALDDLERAQSRILELEGQIAQLNAELQAALVENDSLKVQKAVVDNQYQQSTERYKDQTSKLTFAVIKATKEANARVQLNAQVEGLVAQKDVLRQQLLSLRQLVTNLEGQVQASVDSLKLQADQAKAARESAAQAAEAQRQALQNQQEALESQLAGSAAETSAAAQGFSRLSDNESYFKVDSNEQGADLKWTTEVKSPKGGKAGRLQIQNLKDSGAKITGVSIQVNGSLKDYRGAIVGFGNDNNPTSSVVASINKGATQGFDLYFRRKIGGKNKPEPDKKNFLNKAHDYSGTFTITARYDNGTTAKTPPLTWKIRKNKG